MSMFNDALIKAFRTGRYICPECGALMEFEDEGRSTLICLNCGYDEDIDHYGFTDEEYQALYPTKEEVCGYEDDEDDEDDEYNGEAYDEVYGELSDD